MLSRTLNGDVLAVWVASKLPSVDVVVVCATVDDVLHAADHRRRGWPTVSLADPLTAEPDGVDRRQLLLLRIIIIIIIGCSCCRLLEAKMTSERVDIRESVLTCLFAVCPTVASPGFLQSKVHPFPYVPPFPSDVGPGV